MTLLAVGLVVGVLVVFGSLVPFALHRSVLLWRARKVPTVPPGALAPTPRVTVQLPIYNEANVVGRLIDAAAALEYPTHLLEIQLLDDSSDETVALAAERVAYWRARGLDVQHIRRTSRTGFKAGALAHGLSLARGEFILILDADFVAPPELLTRLLPPFNDSGVGMVQARWSHLNADDSLLTRGQAALLDAHFALEHTARHASRHFFNFNGTAGIWRARALRDAGGWQHDTLTEDLDISYRAQLAGWRFAYLDGSAVPAELPGTLSALRIQQTRWAQGGVQTARKLLPSIWRSAQPGTIKREATFHLLAHLTHPLTLLLAVLLLPALWARRVLGLPHSTWTDLLAFGVATLPFLAFYAVAARRRGRPLIRSAFAALLTGIGLSGPLSGAALKGLFSTHGEFRRTPKRGSMAHTRYRGPGRWGGVWAQTGVFAWLAVSMGVAVVWAEWSSLPFLALFAAGHGWFTWLGLREAWAHQVEDQQAQERHPDEQAHDEREGPVAVPLKVVEAPVRKEDEAA